MNCWYTEKHTPYAGLTFSVSNILTSFKTQYQELTILDTPEYGKVLLLDGLVMLTDKDEFVYHEMISHVPMFAHKKPEHILIIGGGDGGTAREVLKHETVRHIDLVEIDDMVIESCKQFFPQVSNGAFESSRVKVHVVDGIQFTHDQVAEIYDVVIIDSSDPVGPSQGLFVAPFYAEISRILKKDGIMVAQSETPFGRKEVVQSMYREIRKEFSVASMYLAYIPTYPSGMWSFAFCPKEVIRQIDAFRYINSDFTPKYYNTSVHEAAFCLPNFVRELLR